MGPFFVEDGVQNDKGFDLGVEPPRINTCSVHPPPPEAKSLCRAMSYLKWFLGRARMLQKYYVTQQAYLSFKIVSQKSLSLIALFRLHTAGQVMVSSKDYNNVSNVFRNCFSLVHYGSHNAYYIFFRTKAQHGPFFDLEIYPFLHRIRFSILV